VRAVSVTSETQRVLTVWRSLFDTVPLTSTQANFCIYRCVFANSNWRKWFQSYTISDLSFLRRNSPTRALAASLLRFLYHSQLDTYIPHTR